MYYEQIQKVERMLKIESWIVIGKELASKAEAEIRKGLKGDYEGTMCCTQTNGSPNSDNI